MSTAATLPMATNQSEMPTIPVLNPDTGEVHAIPTNQVDDARAAGGKPVAKMVDPQGTMRYVPMDQVETAQQNGGKLVPYGSDQPSSMGVGDYINMGWKALTTPEPTGTRPGILGNIETAAHNIGARAITAGTSMFTHPLDTLQSIAETTPPGQAVDMLLGRQNPFQRRAQEFQSEYAQDKPLAFENAAGDALGMYEGGRLTGDLLNSKPVQATVNWAAKPISTFASNRMAVPGENYSPIQHASLSGVLARGSGAGKGYFPKEVASTIGSALRQTAADNPTITQAITSGSPEDSLAGTQALLGKLRQSIDSAHQQALQPVANTSIDPSPIQNAVRFPSSLNGFAPEDAAAVNDLRARLGNVRTLGGLNDLRMYLNQALTSQFRQNPVAAGNSGAVTGAMQDALNAAREQYYNELQKATGQNFQGAKRMESGVLSAEEALGNAAPGLAARQAVAEQPRSVRGDLASALQGANGVKTGPISGIAHLAATKLLGETPMRPVQEGLQSFFKNLPAPTPLKPAGTRIYQAQSVPNSRMPLQQARLPAQTAGQVRATNAPQSLQERLAGSYAAQGASSYPRAYSEPAVPTAQPVPDRGVIYVNPKGDVWRGPAAALPERTGAPLQLGSGEGNPEFATPPASPPPALNPATARTNVYAGTPRPTQEPIPARSFTVSPEGVASQDRAALPPPETHAWSRSAWSKVHPAGNVKAAETLARQKGYQVID